GPGPRQRHDADAARLRRAADVVAERHRRLPLHLPLLRLPLELLVVLVDHAHAGRAGRVAEGLESAVRVDGQLAAQLEGAALDVVLGRTLLAEALGELAPRDDRGRRAVGLRGAVVEAEGPGDDAGFQHVVHRDLALQHRLGRERAVVVVLDRDARQVLAPRAVGLEVARGAV